ncbi:hypothetical protein, partial [Streptomyces sp. P17]|uniref:hypothetical protein n=1 Tax=Streptomyces sp. P17 TaxID=3074716 RepID=UPI0028F3E71E
APGVAPLAPPRGTLESRPSGRTRRSADLGHARAALTPAPARDVHPWCGRPLGTKHVKSNVGVVTEERLGRVGGGVGWR